MEGLVSRADLRASYQGKRVFITGHTGFKGSWLTQWLLMLGAEVTGYSLPPPTDPALFLQLELAGEIRHIEADIRDLERLSGFIVEARPDFVFHLAAQPLVRYSYKEPRETYEVNVLGTVNVLEALRRLDHPCAAVMITTDKCYENREWFYGYREEDPLGGYDPYSSSKAAAELVIAAYRRSFFGQSKIALASARAGNVIGGGDWAVDRIVPDCVRYLSRGESIPVRNPHATRPWQHVLEPLSGYLLLGARLSNVTNAREPGLFASAFNFGPTLDSNRSVGELVEHVLSYWPGRSHVESDTSAPHEAGRLNLATDKAFHLLGWSPVWNFEQTVKNTVDWYRETAEASGNEPEMFRRLTKAQITEYEQQR